MARGKNYVNNNRGLHLQAGNKSAGTGSGAGGKKSNQVMQMCEYGEGCTRPDCIYRHEEPNSGNKNGSNNSNNRDAVCVLFLAGKCSFKDKGCRKRHPSKEEVARLLVKYKKIRCRFGDDCYTDSCLFLHPRDNKDKDPVAFIEPHHFPPLHHNVTCPSAGAVAAKPIPNSAWNSAPVGVQGKITTQAETTSAFAPPGGSSAPQQQQKQPPSNHESIPGPPPPSPNPLHQPPPTQHHGMPPQGWYPPNGAGEVPPSSMMMMPPPPQQYYGPGAMLPQHIIDPSTGYPMDPSYFELQQQQQFHGAMMYQHHPGMPYPPAPYGIPMGMPYEATHFNVEAKEFVPEGSA